MTEENENLTNAISAILLTMWDPIGIADVPVAADEYDRYVAPLIRRLRAGASSRELAAILLRIETEEFDLPGDTARARRVAERLQALLD